LYHFDLQGKNEWIRQQCLEDEQGNSGMAGQGRETKRDATPCLGSVIGKQR
jgi:hypothetical protein